MGSEPADVEEHAVAKQERERLAVRSPTRRGDVEGPGEGGQHVSAISIAHEEWLLVVQPDVCLCFTSLVVAWHFIHIQVNRDTLACDVLLHIVCTWYLSL